VYSLYHNCPAADQLNNTNESRYIHPIHLYPSLFIPIHPYSSLPTSIHLLLQGSQGTGETTLGKVVLNGTLLGSWALGESH
jgi:hypothetical protein